MAQERKYQKWEQQDSNEIQLVVFKIGVEEFGVEITQIREIVRLVPVTPIPRAPDFVEGVVNLRGQIVAVIDLAKRINLKPNPRSDKTRIIVVEVGEHTVGMIVDEVSEVLRMPEKNIDKTPDLIATEVQAEYIQGVGKIEERLLILIDLGKILSQEEVQEVKKMNKNKPSKGQEDEKQS